MTGTIPFGDPRVAARFRTYPAPVRRKLLALRRLIFETAADMPDVGPLAETIKWGEPAYLTAATGTGTTIRIDWKPARPDRYAMYFHCRTTLVPTFRRRFGGVLRFEGNRALSFGLDESLPVEPVASCIRAALTYHARRRRRRHVPTSRRPRTRSSP